MYTHIEAYMRFWMTSSFFREDLHLFLAVSLLWDWITLIQCWLNCWEIGFQPLWGIINSLLSLFLGCDPSGTPTITSRGVTLGRSWTEFCLLHNMRVFVENSSRFLSFLVAAFCLTSQTLSYNLHTMNTSRGIVTPNVRPSSMHFSSQGFWSLRVWTPWSFSNVYEQFKFFIYKAFSFTVRILIWYM